MTFEYIYEVNQHQPETILSKVIVADIDKTIRPRLKLSDKLSSQLGSTVISFSRTYVSYNKYILYNRFRFLKYVF